MPNGFAQLGNALAGGGVLPASIAEAQGEQLGANTQNAIAEAQLRQQKFQGRQNFAGTATDLASATQDPTKLGAALTAAAQGDISLDMILKGVNQNQQNNSYNQIVNPETSDAIVARHLAAEGREGGLIRPTAAGEASTNILHPEQGVQTTPLGQALIPAKAGLLNAQANAASANANLHNTQSDAGGFKPPVDSGGGAGVKLPPGFQWAVNDDGTPKMDSHGQREATSLTGGPKDPNFQGPMSDTSRRFFASSINAATGGTAELENIMRLPVGSDKGLLGIGGTPGHGVLDTPFAALKNKLSSNDTQQYNARINNLARYIATAENAGRMPPAGAVEAVNGMALQEGDTESTRLTKLAQGRQALDSALDSWKNTIPLNDTSRAYVEKLQDRLKKAIPFTVEDVDHMLQSGNPQQTIGQSALARLNVGGAAGASGSPGPAAASPAAAMPPPQALAQLQEGHVTTFGNGQKWTLQGGKPTAVQ